MTKHRSKKSRIRVQERRSSNFKVAEPNQSKSKNEDSAMLFSYDPKLIVKDLKKTFLLVVFILLVLLSVTLIYT